MHVALLCYDKPNNVGLRKATREAHLAYARAFGDKLSLGGFFYDEDGQPNGSLLILNVETVEEAKNFAANDPYQLAGLFEKVDIRPRNWTVNAPALGE